MVTVNIANDYLINGKIRGLNNREYSQTTLGTGTVLITSTKRDALPNWLIDISGYENDK